MQCEIILDPRHARRWMRRLGEQLQQRGHQVGFRMAAGPARPIGWGGAIVETIEAMLYRPERRLGGLLSPIDLAAINQKTATQPADLLIDLTGVAKIPPAERAIPRLVVTADGGPLEAGIAAALFARRPPRLAVTRYSATGDEVIVTGLPAVPDASVYTRGYETVVARVVTLIVAAVGHSAAGDLGPVDTAIAGRTQEQIHVSLKHGFALTRCGIAFPDGEPVSTSPGNAPVPPGAIAGIGFVLGAVLEKLRLKLKRRRGAADRWTVGWREMHGDPVIETLAWPQSGYHWLPDDGLRYYADPFVFAHFGRRFLFVEEYVYATGRGHISVAEWTGAGWTTPVLILERPYHLSWPRVFQHDGEIYMLPETSGIDTLELYRAVDFPKTWELASVLATEMTLADATTLTRDGRTFVLAAMADGVGASSWDGLAILEADGPTMPLRPVSDGVCLVDVTAARPAGEIVRVGDEWRRPAQDCTLGYGSGLTIARIDQLGRDGFRQTILARLAPDPRWGAIGVHTLNCTDGIEVIDINRGFDIRRRPPLSR